MFCDSAGKKYGVNHIGKPDGNRPQLIERWRLVARKPVLAAIYLHIPVKSFQELYLGWPPGAKQQANPDCLFGQVSCSVR